MFPCGSFVTSLKSTKELQRSSFSSAALSPPSTVQCHRLEQSLCLGTCQVNPHIPDAIPAKRLEHMLEVPVPQTQQEITNFAAHLPLIAMLVLQARVSKRLVEEIAEFEVVMVTPVDRGCLWAAEPRSDCGGESDIKNKCRYVLRSRCWMCLCLKDRKRMPRYSNASQDLLRSSACRNAPQNGRWKCAWLRDGRELLQKSGSP